MAEFYPFNEAGCEILYENPHFFVAFGWDKQNECYSVGMRWGGLANHYPLSPRGDGKPQWFYTALGFGSGVSKIAKSTK